MKKRRLDCHSEEKAPLKQTMKRTQEALMKKRLQSCHLERNELSMQTRKMMEQALMQMSCLEGVAMLQQMRPVDFPGFCFHETLRPDLKTESKCSRHPCQLSAPICICRTKNLRGERNS